MVFQRWRQRRARVSRTGVAGYRAYAIGDVHGRLDLLDGLLRKIEADHYTRGGEVQPILIFVGDLIDRGPQSRGVIQRVIGGSLPGFQTVALCGNHEEILIRLLNGEEQLLGQWLRFGGAECLLSYGVDPTALLALEETEALRQLRAAIPVHHQAFLSALGDTFRFGDYLFVHAGIRPGIPVENQSGADLRWIRQPFLVDRREHGAVVVHGHTISRTVEDRPNRIGIDTGAYRHGVLTALAVEGEERWFLQQVEKWPENETAPPGLAAP